jgi:hypothetical protein
MKNAELEIEQSMRYEYYIHYLDLDRRNDRWVTEHSIKIDPGEISKLEALYIEENDTKKIKGDLDREK